MSRSKCADDDNALDAKNIGLMINPMAFDFKSFDLA